MNHWARRIFVVAATLLLTGCLWGPGKFTSNLTLRKDGSFILEYRGELVLQIPNDEAKAEPWSDSMAHCFKDGRTEIQASPGDSSSGDDDSVPCTAAQIAKLKAQYQSEAAAKASDKRKQDEEMAKMFGLPGLDDDSNRAFAAKLMKYSGWRSVTYRGKGVFDVDYRFEGKATQDFIFPAIPDDNFIVPFVALRHRADGSVLVTAPAFTGGMGPMGAGAAEAAGSGAGGPPPSRAQGRFTIVTDGEILTNNSEDGASSNPLGRELHWDVSPASTKSPEALIRLQ